ncbi:unnamed protein product [Clavelina lepadiformis]|uniref:Homeobox domain-containing protein n=1 Tax=Clavelina lepadiformis TaxID=159417 RepID=A0ABP0FR40_CLALP
MKRFYFYPLRTHFFSTHQRRRLKQVFCSNPYISRLRKAELARELGLTKQQIGNWFIKERAKAGISHRRQLASTNSRNTSSIAPCDTRSWLPWTEQQTLTTKCMQTGVLLLGASVCLYLSMPLEAGNQYQTADPNQSGPSGIISIHPVERSNALDFTVTSTLRTTNASLNQTEVNQCFGDGHKKECKDRKRNVCDQNQNTSLAASPLHNLWRPWQVGTAEHHHRANDSNQPGPSGINRSHSCNQHLKADPNTMSCPDVGRYGRTDSMLTTNQAHVAQSTLGKGQTKNEDRCDFSQSSLKLVKEFPRNRFNNPVASVYEHNLHYTTHPYMFFPYVVRDESRIASPTTTNASSNQDEDTQCFGDRRKNECLIQNEESGDRNQNISLAASRLHNLWSPCRGETAERHHRTIDPNQPGPSGISRSHFRNQHLKVDLNRSCPDVGRYGREDSMPTANQAQSTLGKRQTKNENRSGFSQWTQKLVKVFPRNHSNPPQKKIKIAADRGSSPCRAAESSTFRPTTELESEKQNGKDKKSNSKSVEESSDQSKQAATKHQD